MLTMNVLIVQQFQEDFRLMEYVESVLLLSSFLTMNVCVGVVSLYPMVFVLRIVHLIN